MSLLLKKISPLLLLVLGVLLAPQAFAEEGESPARRLIDARAASIVSIQFVKKSRISFMGQTQDEEANAEVRGVLLSTDGLVLTASAHFDGGAASRSMRAMGAEIDLDVSVSDIRVLFGTESEEYEAQLVAKDTNLGVAFVQILDLKGREVKALNLDGALDGVDVGDDLLGLTRLVRGFDCAPSVSRGYVVAAVERPRKMWAVAGDGDLSGVGMPVFDVAGRLAGFLSVQEVAEGAQESSGGMLGGLMSQAQSMGSFLLPVSAIKPLVAAAKVRAQEMRRAAAEDQEADDVDEPGEADEPDDDDDE